jgi:hypothetical protein
MERPTTRSPPDEVDILKLAERALEASRRERQRIEAAMPELSQEWAQANARLTELTHTTEHATEIDSQPGEPLDSSVLPEDFPLLAVEVER